MSLDILTTQAIDVLNAQANRALFAIADNPLVADWDLKSFLVNATTYIKFIGGLVIVLLGTAAVVWGAYKFFGKLFGGQSAAQTSWVTVALLIIIGGAAMAGGGALVFGIAEGGKTTIEDLGGGTILPYLLTMWP